MKEKLSNNKKLFITILIGIAFLISISFAIYNIVLEGQRTHNITTNKLTFSYKEPIESLNLISYNSLTDEEGKAQNNYYEFTVKGTSEAPEVIDYVIYLQKEEVEKAFNESDLKVYLTKVENDVETEVVAPTLLSEFLEYNNISDTKALYGSSMNLTGNEDITDTYRLRIWLKEEFDFNSLKSVTNNNGEQNIKIEQYEYKFKVNVATGVMMPITNLDKSGANEPVLATNIIPVYYDETNGVWKKANSNNSDETNKWYDYDNKMWANAVTVSETNRDTYMKASVGTPISMDDVNTMWVWIPRFSATGDTANYNGGTQSAPGAFNITFVNNTTTAHDAFTFGSEILSGFWVGKFETSHNTLSSSTTDNNLGCTSDTCSNANGIIIKPNVQSLIYNNVSNFFYASLSMSQTGNSFGFDKTKDTTLDTHMMKNNEWGAVAYLTQSIYGRCTSSTSCTEVGINNSSSYITGTGAPAGTYEDTNNGTYETTLGQNASTTGNIYGVYDMSGGSFEYVMDVYTDGTKNWSGNDSTYNSGFSGCLGSDCSSTYDGVAYPDSKYYNSYTNEANYTNSNLQYALTETKNWFGDDAYFVAGDYPWFVRGGAYDGGSYSGVFYCNHSGGYVGVASRSVLAK